MSFIFSRALVAESLQVNCLAVDAFAPLSAIPTPKPCLLPGRTMEPLRLSRFGMTFEPLTDAHGAELLALWLADFPAKTSALPAVAMASTESAADSGQRWRGSFARYSPAESKWKTAQCSLLAGSDEFLETWPRWGSMRNGVSFLRPTWTPPIFESASGSPRIYPTPVAIDSGSGRFNTSTGSSNKRPTLALMARKNLWPTPTVCGNYNRKGASKSSGDGLSTAVKLWPTPCASASASASKGSSQAALVRKSGKSRENSRIDHAVMASDGGQLNPEWVEWLMGWPIGHTALEPLETARFQEWQQQHGKS